VTAAMLAPYGSEISDLSASSERRTSPPYGPSTNVIFFVQSFQAVSVVSSKPSVLPDGGSSHDGYQVSVLVKRSPGPTVIVPRTS